MRGPIVFLTLLLVQGVTPAPSRTPAVGSGRGAAIAIIAVEDGTEAPVEGAIVNISPVPLGPTPIVLKVITPADGQVAIRDLAPGTYQVAATPPDRLSAVGVWYPLVERQVRTVRIAAGERPVVRFAFSRPPAVSGQVLTSDSKPAAGVIVELATWSALVHDRPVLAPARSATSDGNGRFTMDRLVPGQYYFRARPPAASGQGFNFIYSPGTLASREATRFVLNAGDEIALSLMIRVVPAVTVTGRVEDARGAPVAKVRVSLTALDRSARPVITRDGGWANQPDATVRTDARGQFRIPGVLAGLYALRAVERHDDKTPVVAAGVLELEVGTSDVTDLIVATVPTARVTGRFVFNGAEDPDPARTEIGMAPDGEHDHLRWNLASSDTWHADGQFEVDGLLGSQRMTLGSSGAWFIERAVLEDGTEISTWPYTFKPGLTYANVRVWLSDRVATVGGPLPAWWDRGRRTVIVAFPEEPALRTAGSRHVRTATVSSETGRFSILGLPPGHAYLVAAYAEPAIVFEPVSEELFGLLTPLATRITVDEARSYEVALGPLLER